MSILILKNATAAQIYPAKVWENVDIAIESDKILAVGPGLCQRYPQAQVKEMRGQLVMPGMVCSHNHFYSGLSRGIQANIAPSPDFISTLKNLWWRLDRALDEESLYYSGLICAMEAVRSGCTAVVDHHASPHYRGLPEPAAQRLPQNRAARDDLLRNHRPQLWQPRAARQR